MKFIKGEIPVSKLKQHKVVFFMYMSPEQLKKIEDITGPAVYRNSIYMPDGERLSGLFDSMPVGFTAIWHLSIMWYPSSSGEVITGKESIYTPFLEQLRKNPEYAKTRIDN